MKTIIMIVLLSICACAHADRSPVWVAANAPGTANRVMATVRGGSTIETLGLWFPGESEWDPLPWQFDPVGRKPGGWGAVDWLEPGSYIVQPTWWDEFGVPHPLPKTMLTVQ
jgi:hypothetical protein